jgi:hypothetical protein
VLGTGFNFTSPNPTCPCALSGLLRDFVVKTFLFQSSFRSFTARQPILLRRCSVGHSFGKIQNGVPNHCSDKVPPYSEGRPSVCRSAMISNLTTEPRLPKRKPHFIAFGYRAFKEVTRIKQSSEDGAGSLFMVALALSISLRCTGVPHMHSCAWYAIRKQDPV